MHKSYNQKLRMLAIIDVFNEYTDDDHSISLEQIQELLLEKELGADRKTLYQDFNYLTEYGFEIIKENIGRTYYYKLVTRPFDLAELKFLVDSVQAAKFITERKSSEIIEKLSSPYFVSKYQAEALKRQVHINGRVKTINKSILLNIDKIHEAIKNNKQIRFKYFQWNAKKEAVYKHDGAMYYVSPWALIWDDENYYLVAFDSEAQKVKHFRVDKMTNMSITENIQEALAEKAAFNAAEYSKSAFGMYGGKRVTVTLEAETSLVGVLIDRFGKDVAMYQRGKNKVEVWADVMLSPQFYGWLAGFGSAIRVTKPQSAVDDMKKLIKELKSAY
ncbi:MAG: WYL domain-containing protein [Phascolarctobacterium sp.]|nr:WYL domain-containing protein [Phascolarctobacterium sp.]